jgi:hypothetical protein
MAFARDREHPLAVEGVGWLAKSDVSEEGMERGQTRISSSDAIAALLLKVV